MSCITHGPGMRMINEFLAEIRFFVSKQRVDKVRRLITDRSLTSALNQWFRTTTTTTSTVRLLIYWSYIGTSFKLNWNCLKQELNYSILLKPSDNYLPTLNQWLLIKMRDFSPQFSSLCIGLGNSLIHCVCVLNFLHCL